MNNFPDILQYSIAKYIDAAMLWLLANFSLFFDFIQKSTLWFLMLVENILLWCPWWLIIAIVIALGCLATKKLLAGIFMGALMMVIGVLGLWDLTMMTLSIVISAVIICLFVGIPVGIWMANSKRVENILKPMLDAMQTMPSFVYLIPALMLFGMGKVPGLFATVIYALPPIIRLTNLGLRQVPEEIIEAGKAFGSTTIQLLTKVQLPLAKPSIMSGINQTTMMALAMVVIASMIGARGVGEEVLIAIGRIEIGRGFEAGLAIVILAVVIDRILQGFGQRNRSST